MNGLIHNSLLKKVMMTAAAIIFMFAASQNSNAQDYCIDFGPNAYNYPGITCYPGYLAALTYYDWYFDVPVVSVRIESEDGDEVLNYESGPAWQGCYVFQEDAPVAELSLGGTYFIEYTVLNKYYSYSGNDYCELYNYTTYYTHRLFIDWNADGFFEGYADPYNEWINNDRSDNPNRLDLNERVLWRNIQMCGEYHTYRYQVTVPDNAPLTQTRMRVMAAYYYPYPPYPPENACFNGYFYPYDGTAITYAYNYGEVEDYVIEFTLAIKDAFPRGGSILYAGQDYDGTTREINIQDEMQDVFFEHPMVLFGGAQSAGTKMTYKITGPMPSTNVVFEAIDPINGSTNINVEGYARYDIIESRGSASPYGTGVFNADQGGEYRLAVSLSLPGKDPNTKFYPFTVAWTNDLSVRNVVSPRTSVAPRYYKYMRGTTVPVIVEFQNVGITDVTEFSANVIIRDDNGIAVWERDAHWEADDDLHPALRTGDVEEVRFPGFRATDPGNYTVEVVCDLMSAIDQESFNDYFARPGEPLYTFEVGYEIQLEAFEILNPKNEEQLIAKRPIRPKTVIKNHGVSDASDIPVKLTVRDLDNNQIVWQNEQQVQDVPSGLYNRRDVFFDPMVITNAGNYEICFEVDHYDDVVIDDNVLCQTFSVIEGMAGNYTIGTLNTGNARNFPTVEEAMDALYAKGIVDDVTFYFTDEEYTIEANGPDQPAWDLTTMILGAGYDAENDRYNEITFKPSQEMQLRKGSIQINLVSGNGKGLFFGQSVQNMNPNTVFSKPLGREYFTKYANSAGYINIDGGPYKSFVFELFTEAEHGAAFYLNRGSSNITVKNCIIKNGSPDIFDNVWLPYTMYDPTVQDFAFDNDSLIKQGGVVESYSAGVVNRSIVFKSQEFENMDIDTLTNDNNKIIGNEISGFAYGIVGIGIGQLKSDDGQSFSPYYNKNNQYSQNVIHDIYAYGIFTGYEQDSKINNNYIYNIGGGDYLATGITTGEFSRDSYKGYHNIRMEIIGNEVHDIQSGIEAAGILVIQSENTLAGDAGFINFPGTDEASKIANNVLWSIKGSSTFAGRAGIALMTERMTNNGEWYLLVPKVQDYFTKGDQIVNNTISLNPDNYSNITAGILVQQAQDCKVFNNAVSVVGQNNAQTATACMFYQGVLPNEGNGMMSDRNVFWYPENNDAVIALFAETDEDNNLIEYYMPNDFKNISQWRTWTGQDTYSVFSNFMNDMQLEGFAPMQKLRVKTNPVPQGSVLNDRGDEFSWLTTDIDGTIRGIADRRFDIGAVEFDGRKNVTDVEVSYVNYPAAWQAVAGQFADAEYIMDDGPVDVKAIARNDGSLERISVDMTVNIYRQQPDGTYGDPVLTQMVEADIRTNESEIVSFGLADGEGDDFVPQTYSDLRLLDEKYDVPEHFSTMAANVTPIYKIVVETEPDEHNGNNVAEKYVRYYIQRSPMRLMVTAADSYVNIGEETAAETIASKLNYDYLVDGFKDLGWYVDVDNMVTTDNDVFDYDVFDRHAWEPKAVNYRMYRSMVWSDGDGEIGDAMNRYEIKDLKRFFNENYYEDKQNLLIGSQELLRTTNDTEFLNEYMSAAYATPGNPLGVNVSNDGNSVVGRYVAKDLVEDIAATGVENDPEPYCGLMTLYTEGSGNAFVAYDYVNHDASEINKTMGVATTTLDRNVMYLGVDWRHFTDVYRVLRGGFDFVEKNDGYVIPVELANFDARYVGNKVSINWATASEMNTDRFEVEKAVKGGDFAKIAEVTAKGNSQQQVNYGPVFDRDVTVGNVYVYRLKVVDFNGEFSYSDVREVEIGGEFWLSEAKPNPASDVVRFDLNGVESSDVTMTIVDVDGKVIMPNYTISGGSLEVDLSSVASGTYTMLVKVGTETLTRQFKVVR
jgi:hypothetical protein